MKIETTRFGSQEVEQEKIIHFPYGLLNDTRSQDFKLFHKEDSGKIGPIVFWLQSVSDPEVAYTIFDPSLANFYYEVLLPDEEYELLSSEDSSHNETDEIIMMVIISNTEGDKDEVKKEGLVLVNANITEPLFINLNSLKGLQRSIKDLDYDIFMNVPVVK